MDPGHKARDDSVSGISRFNQNRKDRGGKLRHRRQLLIHVDSCLKLLDPSIETDAIPNKRLTKRVKLFRQGELECAAIWRISRNAGKLPRAAKGRRPDGPFIELRPYQGIASAAPSRCIPRKHALFEKVIDVAQGGVA